ncbi:MAG: NAD(P)-binding domain-containing protein, partial [Pseudomonadota bacterium]
MTTRDPASSSEAPTDQTARGSRLAGAPTRIGIMGAGAWGTALAVTAQRAGRHVSIWARDLAVLQDRMDAAPDALRAELARLTQVEALSDLVTCDAVLLVTPAQTIIDVVAQLDQAAQDAGRPLPQLVLCAKGFDRASGRPLSELLDDRTADPAARADQLAVLSGPSFASDVLAGAPTAVTLACADTASGEALARALSHRAFRCYWSPDTVGVQVAGAA